jgi:SM-20-related protein
MTEYTNEIVLDWKTEEFSVTNRADKNGIAVYDDFIDEPFLEEAISFIRERGFRYGWKSNKQVIFSHWNLGFSQMGANSQNRQDIRSELPEAVLKLWESFQPLVLPDHPVLIRAYSNAYTYGNDGYIHKDSDATNEMTAIIYINKGWNANWAGETSIFDEKGEVIRAVLPKWRRLLVFPANSSHVGRAVSRICPQLRTVIVFKARPAGEVITNASRDYLQRALTESGADKHPHSGRRLSDHLLRTYDLLKSWGCEEPICIAGGLHSIYGTNHYTIETLSKDYRPRVQQAFGGGAKALKALADLESAFGEMSDQLKGDLLITLFADLGTIPQNYLPYGLQQQYNYLYQLLEMLEHWYYDNNHKYYP